jgi:hypothetical protein
VGGFDEQRAVVIVYKSPEISVLQHRVSMSAEEMDGVDTGSTGCPPQRRLVVPGPFA